MNIKILTKEESIAYWEAEKAERRKWTTEEILKDARMMMNMPDMGNTKWVLSEDVDKFYKWLETEEANVVWQVTPYTLDLAKYFTINKK